MGKIIYGNKRVLAVVLAFALILGSLTPVQLVTAATSDAVGYKLVNMIFTKENLPMLPYSTDETGVTAVLQRDCETKTEFTALSMKTASWEDKSTERFWMISFSTKNFEHLKFNVSLRSSGTGPRDFKMQYSTDGTVFTDLSEIISFTDTELKDMNTIELPEAASDKEQVYLRILCVSDIAVNIKDGQEQKITSSGASNINNIVVTGDSIDGTLPEIPSTELKDNELPSPSEKAEETSVTTPEVSDTPATVYLDPIQDAEVPEGAVTLDKAYEVPDGTEVKIVGQIQYKYGKNGSVNTTILEDVMDGEIYGFQVFDKLSDYKEGDVIAITGKMASYGEVKQLQKLDDGNYTIEKIKEAELIGPQSVTIAQLMEKQDTFLSEYVVIKDVTLGTYNAKNTPVTDKTGSLNIYQGAKFPEGFATGDQANVYGVFSKYSKTYQLRNGTSENSYKKIGYEVEDLVATKLAKWAGNADFEENVVYGDLYQDNDFLDKEASFTLSTGDKPQYKNTNNGTTEYCLGSNTMALGQHFQMNFATDKYAALNLSFKMRSSNSAAKYYEVLYSTDGVQFERADKISYVINTTTYKDGLPVNSSVSHEKEDKLEATAQWQEYFVKLPDSIANAPKVTIRLQPLAENSRIDGKDSPISKSFPCRLTNITVTGSPIISNTITRLVGASPEAGSVPKGSEVELSCLTSDAVIYYSVNGEEFKEYNADEKPVLNTLPAIVTAYAKADGKEESVKVTYAYTMAQVATVKASPNGGAVKEGTEVKLSCETEGATIYYSFDEGKTYEKYTQKINLTTLPKTVWTYATKEGYTDSEVKVLTFTKRTNENYSTYFGQIHSHTNYSDGAGTPVEAFEHAIQKVNDLDFLAITDHSNYFDNDTSCTIDDGTKSTEWLQGHELADKYTTDKFVGIMGFEMTWSGGAPGHMNTFNTSGFLSRNDTGYGNGSSQSLVNYYASLKTVPDSISQFNHPGTTFGDFYDFGYYDSEIDQLITTIEVGNGEGAIRSSGYFPSYEYYTRALDKGWHVAPTNNQDNHKGFWGDANTARTVVLADSLTRDNIYDALRNMRTYATEDSNLAIQYTLNDEVMGTILEEKPDKVEITVSLEDADKEAIGKVEVIVNGGLCVASKNVTNSKDTVQFSLPADYSYYYIKVTQPDKDIAVTAPVWVGDVDAAGVASVTTSSAMQIQNEPADVTTEIYNNNSKDLAVDSVVFTIGDKVMKSLEGDALKEAGLDVIASQSTKKFTFDLVYDGLGKTTVTATVNANENGVSKIYSNKLELNYVPRSLVSKVIVDGSHSNDYVNGYYEGSITELGQLASKYYEEVIVKKDAMTQEDLKDCSLLVITSPAKTSGTTKSGVAYKPTNFDDTFINMVAEYVKNGGKVILCGIADYKDCASVQTSTELNKLLAAMGATTRVNSDELCDDVNFSNQNYRLYFDDYNKSSKYLDGLVDGMTYSCYSGCGIILDKDAVECGTAEPIVYGHDTTYSLDSKKIDSNYVETPKGSIVACAKESIGENGGAVWVGGTVFLSNYEIDTEIKNNADELSYSNTIITANILKECQKTLEITPIADVRQAQEGEIFTVEGYVTAGTTNVATTFFDTIYMQDETAGIDIFPVAQQGIKIGQKIRITGYVASYQGDKELMVMTYELLEGNHIFKPKKITTKEATDYENFGGSLVQVTGKIVKLDYSETVLNYIYIEDESGMTCKALTDGYIGSTSGKDNTANLKVGDEISAVGILYMNPDGTCIRVRDRDEIVRNQKTTSSETVTYEITYVLGKNAVNALSNPSYYEAGVGVVFADASRNGYTFAGWYTDPLYQKRVVNIPTSKAGNVRVYAKWIANTYQIEFSRSTYDATGQMSNVKATYDKTVRLPRNTFTRKGYVFAGWSTSLKGDVVFKNRASVKNLAVKNGATVKLYAQWTKVIVNPVKDVKKAFTGRTIATVSWKKVSGAEGYKVSYADNSKFTSAKTVYVNKYICAKTLLGLKAGKTYYVKVSAYKKDSTNANVYGKSSSETIIKMSNKIW